MEIHGISNIPVELRSAILRQLPTVQDLLSAIQSNKSLYEAFQEDSTTVSHVLQKQIDTRLFPYVASFLELDKAPQIPRQYKYVAPILEKCFLVAISPNNETLAHITLCEALHVMQLHNTVQRFARKYATQVIELLENEGLFHTSACSLTPSENYRMERSFYIFEVYCTLFGRSRTPLPLDYQLDAFFKRFAPWENEQLACVHDFLLDELEPGMIASSPFNCETCHMVISDTALQLSRK
ncbi:hypothetical protein N7540_005075 [Penicillium herquei]|nr:hypothetical protein N7540_005075 [Penicillium herquei]